MYPVPVEPNPTLTFSTIILSPNAKGKVPEVVNPTDKVRVTSLVVLLNPTVEIPTPLVFSVGII